MGAKIAIFRLRRFRKDGCGGSCESPSGCAPGFRDSGYGELGVLHNVGHDGYSWSSSSVDSDDYYRDLDLSFNTQGLSPNSVHYRAYGLQLRCLSE